MVDADRHHRQLPDPPTPIWATMSRLDDSETVTIRGTRAGHPHLHAAGTRTSGAASAAPTECGGVGQVEGPVDGDRVVQGGEQRPAVGHDRRACPGRSTGCRGPGRTRPAVAASARRTRRLKVSGSGNPAVHISPNSTTSIQERNSRSLGHPERVGLPVEVQAGHRHEADAVVEDRATAGRRRPSPGGRGRPAPGTGTGCRRPGRPSGGCPGTPAGRPAGAPGSAGHRSEAA